MIVLPSRGRAASLWQFFEVSQPQEPGVIMLDDDDVHNYVGYMIPGHWQFMIGKRAGYVELLNRAFRQFPNEPWYAYGGDDVRCAPVGWDTFLAQAAGADAVAYGDDKINGERACCLPFIGGELVRRVGWLGYPALSHLYCDTVWRDIGTKLGVLRYFPEIVTEHLHWSTGKQPYDQTAQERKTTGDHAAYTGFVTHQLAETVARCRA